MAFAERRTADVLLTILFFAVVCAVVYSARRIILIFVLAVFFAYLIDPVVKFLQRHSLFFRNLRGPAVVEVYIAFVILIAALGYAFAPGLARNTVKLVDEVPVLLDGLSTGDIAAELGGNTVGASNRNFASGPSWRDTERRSRGWYEAWIVTFPVLPKCWGGSFLFPCWQFSSCAMVTISPMC
jgi:hypothetical protein